jgi:SAM-dependent methyltransferase
VLDSRIDNPREERSPVPVGDETEADMAASATERRRSSKSGIMQWALDALPKVPVEKAAHDYYSVRGKLLERLEILESVRNVRDLRILELGCGLHAPMVALFGSEGWRWEGVDLKSVFICDGPRALFREYRRRWGSLRALKWMTGTYPTLLMHLRILGELSGTKVWPDRRRLHSYDGRRLPFSDGSFDVIVSNAVLEHVDDLHSVAGELARVLAPEGVIDMLWHNFYCPSGSHLPQPVMAERPWGHVTGEIATSGLNRARPEDVEAAFAEWLDVVGVMGADHDHNIKGDRGYRPEGLDLLDESWRRRLDGLPEELLTTRAFVIQCRKPANVADTPSQASRVRG